MKPNPTMIFSIIFICFATLCPHVKHGLQLASFPQSETVFFCSAAFLLNPEVVAELDLHECMQLNEALPPL